MERDIFGGSGKVAVVMTAAVALASFVALVASCLSQLLSLGFQQLVESFLYASAYQFFDLTLDNFLIVRVQLKSPVAFSAEL